jgi:uncharacterized protein
MLARPLTWLAAVAVAVAATAACRPASPPTGLTERPLLWSAEKDGQKTYLLGTMHIGFNAEKQLPRWVWDKVRASHSFAVETDISDPQLMTTGVRRDGSSLREELGEAHWKKLEEQLGAGANAAQHMTPAAVTSLLEIKGLPAAMPMDLMLLGEAEAADKKVVFLEPASLQVALLEKWIDIATLKAAIDERAAGKASTKELLAAYVAGDIVRIEAIANDREGWKKSGRSDADYDVMMEDLIYKRNASWIEPIEKMHQEGNAMVAVGAMHLIGERSVLDLLERRGYKIARVTSAKQ